MSDSISDGDVEIFISAEERYLDWCEKMGVEPYVCETEDCDRRLPCRKHPPELR